MLGFLAGARGTVLDLPCGAGRMSRLLATAVDGRVVSADYSPAMLAVARRRVANPLLRCDAFALPLRDKSVDRILMLRLIFHYCAPAGILAEAGRVLRPGGELVFDTLNRYSTRWLAEALLVSSGKRRPGTGLRFASARAVEALVARAGLAIVESRSRFLLPTRVYRFLPPRLQSVLVTLERWVPSRLRVLTYWKAVKPA